MTVYETDLPNVGRRFDLDLEDGGTLSVVIRHNGHRVIYHAPPGDEDAETVAELRPEDARQFGAILAGAYFESEPSDAAVPVGEERIDWTTVTDAAAGDTIASVTADVDVTVLAIQRGDDTRGNPAADTELEVGDVLVTLGDAAEQARLRERV